MAGISKKTQKLKNGKVKLFYTITYRDVYGKQHTSGIYATKKQKLKHTCINLKKSILLLKT